MGGFIAEQPNGKLCRFSTVVDTLTDINMTEWEYIEMCVQKAKREAVREAKDTIKRWKQPFSEVKRCFRPNNNTIEEFEELLREMGDTEGLGEERINYLRSLEE